MTRQNDTLAAFLSQTLYAVAVDYGRSIGIGSADMTTDFDDACDQFAEAREEDRAAAVIEINLVDGTSKNVTAAAEARIAKRMVDRKQPLPEWMEAA